MNIEQIEAIQGKKIEILEMTLSNTDNQLELSWTVCFENKIIKKLCQHHWKCMVSELLTILKMDGKRIPNMKFLILRMTVLISSVRVLN